MDTSALLAVIFNEPSALWVLDRVQESSSELRMSVVNYAEAMILITSRQSRYAEEIRDAIEATSIRLVPTTSRQAEIAAEARLRYPLNLGDCFAYALAKDEDCPLLTLDRDFRRTDIKVVLPRPS